MMAKHTLLFSLLTHPAFHDLDIDLSIEIVVSALARCNKSRACQKRLESKCIPLATMVYRREVKTLRAIVPALFYITAT
jgi:hypothetical protein